MFKSRLPMAARIVTLLVVLSAIVAGTYRAALAGQSPPTHGPLASASGVGAHGEAVSRDGSPRDAPATIGRQRSVRLPLPENSFGVSPHPTASQCCVYPSLDPNARNATYHGGPTLNQLSVYTLIWMPSGYQVDANYQAVMAQFLTDEPGLANWQRFTMFALPQYLHLPSGWLGPQVSPAGGQPLFVDTDPYPTSGCTDPVNGFLACLTQQQIEAEVNSFSAANGLTGATQPGYQFSVLLPELVAYEQKDGAYFLANTCAFHYYEPGDGLGGAALTGMINGYGATSGGGGNCDPTNGVWPNSSGADPTIGSRKHEDQETATDWQFNAWYQDSDGNELDDNCHGVYYAPGYPIPAYNQVYGLHGGPQHLYLTQLEWSNQSNPNNTNVGCVAG